MSIRFRIFVALVLTSVSFPTFIVAQENVEFFTDFSTRGLPGRLYVPPEAADGPRPVIVFLHGAGERGSDNVAQINGNINNLLSMAQSRGAYLYAPQRTSGNWNLTAVTDAVMSMTDQIVNQQNGDNNRLYVTGLSLGGGGTWNMASRFADRFAAAVPIAGVNPAESACRHLPAGIQNHLQVRQRRNQSALRRVGNRRPRDLEPCIRRP